MPTPVFLAGEVLTPDFQAKEVEVLFFPAREAPTLVFLTKVCCLSAMITSTSHMATCTEVGVCFTCTYMFKLHIELLQLLSAVL